MWRPGQHSDVMAKISQLVLAGGRALLVAAGSQSVSFPNSISSSWSLPDTIRTTARERSRSRSRQILSGMFRERLPRPECRPMLLPMFTADPEADIGCRAFRPVAVYIRSPKKGEIDGRVRSPDRRRLCRRVQTAAGTSQKAVLLARGRAAVSMPASDDRRPFGREPAREVM